MSFRSSPFVMLAALTALGGCVADNMPTGSTAAPSARIVTSQPTVTNYPVVTTTPVITSGTIFTPPGGVAQTYVVPNSGTTYIVPNSGSSTAVLVPARLNASEVMGLLSDNTVAGIAGNGQPYYARFRHDGQLHFRERDFNDSGSWYVTADGQLCSKLTVTNVGVPECYVLSRNGTAVDFNRPDGSRVGSFTVMPGNPQNL